MRPGCPRVRTGPALPMFDHMHEMSIFLRILDTCVCAHCTVLPGRLRVCTVPAICL